MTASDADVVSVAYTVVDYSTVTPSKAAAAVDNDLDTTWSLTPGQTTGDFTADFDQSYTVSDTKY